MRVAAVILFAVALAAAGENAERYRAQLKTLDSADARSVCSARDQLRAAMANADAAERGEMFRAFRAFYLEDIQASTEHFIAAMQPYAAEIVSWLEKGQSLEDARRQIEQRPAMRHAAAPWFDCGLTFGTAEGDLYPEQNPATLLEFVSRLAPALASYIRFRAKEDAQTVGADAALALTWEELRQRLLRWEAFARGNPQLPEIAAEVEPAIHGLVQTYFFGEDNTPTFDGQTGRIVADLVASWKHLASLDRGSRYQPLAAALVASLDRHRGQITKEDRALFARFGLGDGFDDWWRGYQARMSAPK